MSDETLNIIIAIATVVAMGFMLYLSHILTQRRFRKNYNGLLHVDKQAISFAEEARYNKQIDEILYSIFQKTGATNASIARLHNNGYWNNGASMKKFTVITEKFQNNISVMREYKDVLCSRYATAMDFLFYHNIYWETDMSLCKDSNLKRDMIKCGFSTTYLFLIKQADGERTEEAFIWLFFEKPHVLDKEQQAFVNSLRFKLLGLLNMTKKD